MPGWENHWGKRLLTVRDACDRDDLIVKRLRAAAPDPLKSYPDGESVLKRLENNSLQHVLDTTISRGRPTVISTGGSAVNASCADEFFRNPLNFVVHLDVPMDVLEQRTENFTNRGIVFDGMTPVKLKESRDVLYKLYADLSIPMHKDTDLAELLGFF